MLGREGNLERATVIWERWVAEQNHLSVSNMNRIDDGWKISEMT